MTAADGAEEFVRSVAAECGLTVRTVRFVADAGTVNRVACVSAPDGDVIVRFPRDTLRSNEFAVESWCAAATTGAGVPTAQMIGTGSWTGHRWVSRSTWPG